MDCLCNDKMEWREVFKSIRSIKSRPASVTVTCLNINVMCSELVSVISLYMSGVKLKYSAVFIVIKVPVSLARCQREVEDHQEDNQEDHQEDHQVPVRPRTSCSFWREFSSAWAQPTPTSSFRLP